MLRAKRVQQLPQVDIFHWLLVGGAPSVALPAVQPSRDSVAQVLAIGVNIDEARPLERRERRDCGHELHAVVGGVRLAALELLHVLASRENGAPAARAGIAGAGAVGVDDDVRLAHPSIP